MHTFLFELGMEELPDNVIVPAIENLKTSLEKLLEQENLEYGAIEIASSPRRLALSVTGLAEKQNDVEVCKLGPSVNIALDSGNELTKAGEGFLRKSGGSREDIYIQTTDKGDFIAVKYLQTGKICSEILRDWIISAIGAVPLPKKMIWKDKNLAFSRPIRWIVAMWDSQVIELDYMGIKSDRISYGNRYLGMDRKVTIPQASAYKDILRENRVVAVREERRGMILTQFEELFKDSIYKVREDERLLDTVCNLVEYPYAVIGEFAPSFLSLPEKIITSTISQNQKYFSVYDECDKLTNRFVFVSNGDPEFSEIIRNGNEKVVAARLEDAHWFFAEDTKRSLESYVPQLRDVVFQSRLGTLADKTERVEKLCAWICESIDLDETSRRKAQRTAKLCKADLVTLMLGEKEFTKLQGYMGMQYALAGGEDPEVAQGIYEHYMPRGSNDGLPETLYGAICAVADKLDTVCGIIGVGLMPTGSADPFALRRAAGGVVQILADRAWMMDLDLLIEQAFILIQNSIVLEADALPKIKNFFAQRVSWLLKELGISYDVCASVMQAGYTCLPHLIARARALEDLRQDERFIRLVIGFKRVSNIISAKTDFGDADPATFESDAERYLFSQLSEMSARVDDALEHVDYGRALLILVDFGKVIDNFFDQVLVNCEDQRLRDNRYALLAAIRKEFIKVADLSLIVVESETNGE